MPQEIPQDEDTRDVFDFVRFIDKEFGGAAKMWLTLNEFGEMSPASASICRKWRERRQIPGGWFAVCLVARERQTGKPAELTPYVRTIADTRQRRKTKKQMLDDLDIFA